jgi:hypothetical protein
MVTAVYLKTLLPQKRLVILLGGVALPGTQNLGLGTIAAAHASRGQTKGGRGARPVRPTA